MRRDQLFAKLVVEAAEPGEPLRWIENQSTGQHDFDRTLEDGSRCAIEVTRETDPQAHADRAAIMDPKHGAFLVTTVRCKRDWLVTPEPGAPIKRIRETIDARLAELESLGIKEFYSCHDLGSAAVRRICDDLHLEAGCVARWREPGHIGIGLPGNSYSSTPEDALDALLGHVNRADNRRKLAASGAPHRRLVVIVESDSGAAADSLGRFAPPAVPPALPSEINQLWGVATTMRNTCCIWRAQHGGVWSKSEIPVPSPPEGWD